MYWKTPISSRIFEAFGDDHLARDLFLHLYIRARNKDMIAPGFYEGKPYLLKRGQVIFGKKKYSENLRCAPNTAIYALKRISERQDEHQIKINSNNNYTIVTLIHYDSLISMKSSMDTNLNTNKTPFDKPIDTNKKEKKRIERNRILKPLKKLEKLPYPQVYEIAKDLHINIEDVMQIDKAVRVSVESGNKYKLSDQMLAVKSWCMRAIQKNEIQERNSSEDLVFEDYSPENMEKSRLFNEKLKRENPELI